MKGSKRSFVAKKFIAVTASLIAGMLLSLAAGWIFSKGFLFDFKIMSLYMHKMYIKDNWQSIISGGLICAAVIFLISQRKYLSDAWNRAAGRLGRTAAVRLALISAVIVMSAVIYCGYIFGGRYFLFTDSGMDTIYQFYPMYVHLVNEIRDGTLSLWNFNWGLGCDTLTRQEWIMDPCAWMAVGSGLLFGVRSIKHVLLLAQFIKIMICALVCFEFLGFYGFSHKARFTASCIFAFNGWLMLWGQHYYFGMAVVYLIILLWNIERLLRAYRSQMSDGGADSRTFCYGRRAMAKYYFAVGLTVTLIFLYSVYFGYMIAVFASVYTILRMLYLGSQNEASAADNGIRQSHLAAAALWRELWPVMVTVVIGMLCASVMIIPYADIVLNVSTRVGGSFFERMGRYAAALYSGDYYKTLAGRMISNNIFGITALDQKYYEFPQLAFSAVSLLVIPQTVWFGIIKPFADKKETKEAKNCHKTAKPRQKIIMALSAVLAAAVLIWPFAGAVFNIGVGESLVEDIPAMRFTFIQMPLMALAYAYFIDECVGKNRINILLIVLGVAAVYAISYYAFWNYTIHYRWVNGVLAAVNIVFGIVLVFLRLLPSKFFKKENIVQMFVLTALLCMIGSACFDGYITNEKRYTYDNETECLTNDFHGSATIKALDKIKNSDDSFYRVEKVYHDFSDTGDPLIQDYSPISMYCSTMSAYLARFYSEMYPSARYDYPSTNVEFSEYDNAFAVTNVKYIISVFPLNYDYLEPWSQEDGIYVYRNTHAGSIGIIYNSYMSYSDFEKLGKEDKRKAAAKALLLPDDVMRDIKANTAPQVSDSDLSDLTEGLHPDRSSYFTKSKDSRITGNINAKTDGMLMLSVPYREGWNVYIDGVRQETANAEYGFMAVPVTKGAHEVEVKYENKLYALGAALSIAGVVLAAFWFIYCLYNQNNCGKIK